MCYTSLYLYNELGLKISHIKLPEPIMWVSGRVSIGQSGLFYKGLGTLYSGHFSLNMPKDVMCSPKSCLPLGSLSVNRNWEGKFGIFNELYGPGAREWIGACGPREKTLINNSIDFKRSDIIYYSCNNTFEDYSYYVVDYRDKRKTFLEGGDVKELVALLDYMITEGWCFPWDKYSILDISFSGNVTDVADVFRSNQDIAKLATVFSVLRSLEALDRKTFYNFLQILGVPLDNTIDYNVSCLNVFTSTTKNCFNACRAILRRHNILFSGESSKMLLHRIILECRNGTSLAYGADGGQLISEFYLKRLKLVH